MPKAKSSQQRKAAGAALSAKRGKQKASELKGPARSMYKSMSEEKLKEMAGKSKSKKKK